MSDTKRKFAHLHVHTSYSLLDGISLRKDLIVKAKEHGQTSLAITDHGSIFNAVSYYRAAKEAGIKPIIGEEFYVAPDSRLNRTYSTKAQAAKEAEETGDLSMSAYHLTILAKNNQGYENIKLLSTIAYREGFYRKPRIDLELLEAHKGGLIVLSGCLASMTSRYIIAGQLDKAEELIDRQRVMFGEDFFLEVMHHDIADQGIVNEALIDFGNKRGIPLVMTNDSHFTNKEDGLAHEVALAIGTNKRLADENRFKFNGEGYWFKSGDEMQHAADMAGIPASALDNTLLVANSVEDYDFKLGKSIIPHFKDANNKVLTADECNVLVEEKAFSGLRERGLADKAEYVERLKMELDMIKRKEFSSYFLIISDIIDFMRNSGQLAPIGRGSSVSSLACYCLFITGLDPIWLDIPFSRFINEGRKDLPDIDTDISKERRHEVLKYIVDKYGADKVAHIVTFQSMGPKASCDNVGRVLDVPVAVRRQLGQMFGEDTGDDTLEEILAQNPAARKIIDSVPGWKDISIRLEGNNRNLSEHAAGIVISNDPIVDHSPLVRDSKDGFLITQYDMGDLSQLGMLKLDMLGLRAMDTIKNTIDLVKSTTGDVLDFQKFDLTDKATYDTITEGKFASVFQYDSQGLRQTAKQLRPDTFEHLIALNALYRPGPMLPGSGFGGKSILENYIARRHGHEPLESWHPSLDAVFKRTYSLCIFQESVMVMSKIIAGFTDTEADEYRSAIGKKDKVKFDAANAKFLTRGVANGHTSEFMKDIIKKLEGFARYGWNIGHCLQEDTKVLTCDRGWVDIKDIEVGEYLWSFRHGSGNLFRNKVVNVIDNGIKSVRRITAGDRSIDTTDSHLFVSSEQKYKRADKFVVGDSLKMLDERVARAELNINMTLPTYSNKIPLRVTLGTYTVDTIGAHHIGGGIEHDTAVGADVRCVHGKLIDDWNIDSNVPIDQPARVYDLTMEEDPNFIANGFVVHNSASYSYLSYVTAYLETHYPVQYFTSLLNVNLDKSDKLKILLAAILQKCVKVLPPDINKSHKYFVAGPSEIYMGISSIRNVGDAATKPIIAERDKGPYLDLVDFCIRHAKSSNVTKLVKENLIKASAFDFDKSMTNKDKVDNIELIQSIVKKFVGKVDPSVIREQIELKLKKTGAEYTKQEVLAHERTVLNFYISSHPITEIQKLFSLFSTMNLITPSQIEIETIGNSVMVIGVVDSKEVKTTVNGDPYINMTLSDQIGSANIKIWQPLATTYANKIANNQVVLLGGTVKDDKRSPGQTQLYVRSVLPIMSNDGLPIKGFYAKNNYDIVGVVDVLGAKVKSINGPVLNIGYIVMFDGATSVRLSNIDKLTSMSGIQYVLDA
jgi:DNA-directed DNA polymerase III PolC